MFCRPLFSFLSYHPWTWSLGQNFHLRSAESMEGAEKLIFKITELFSIMNKQARGASVRYDQKSKEGDKTTHETVSPFFHEKVFCSKKDKTKNIFLVIVLTKIFPPIQKSSSEPLSQLHYKQPPWN